MHLARRQGPLIHPLSPHDFYGPHDDPGHSAREVMIKKWVYDELHLEERLEARCVRSSDFSNTT
jgi:hypothetical protein